MRPPEAAASSQATACAPHTRRRPRFCYPPTSGVTRDYYTQPAAAAPAGGQLAPGAPRYLRAGRPRPSAGPGPLQRRRQRRAPLRGALGRGPARRLAPRRLKRCGVSCRTTTGRRAGRAGGAPNTTERVRWTRGGGPAQRAAAPMQKGLSVRTTPAAGRRRRGRARRRRRKGRRRKQQPARSPRVCADPLPAAAAAAAAGPFGVGRLLVSRGAAGVDVPDVLRSRGKGCRGRVSGAVVDATLRRSSRAHPSAQHARKKKASTPHARPTPHAHTHAGPRSCARQPAPAFTP